MQTLRLTFVAVGILCLQACGSSSGQAKGVTEETPELTVWYLLEVGGRPESGRSHYYRLSFLNHENCKPDSLHFTDQSFAFKFSDFEGVWEAYRHFEPTEKDPGGILSAEISFTCYDRNYRVRSDSIYLKESIILP